MSEPSTTTTEINDMTVSSVMGKPELTDHTSNDIINSTAAEEHARFQQQLVQLRHQQQLQQQLLLQHFQQQQRQLTEQHERQLQQRVQEFLEQQKKIEDEHKQEKERKERERLEQLKHKEKHEYSAVASTEVKQSLQEFILNKKQREAASGTGNPPRNFKTWSRLHTSLDQASPPSTLSPHCKHVLGKYDDDFPLRKTASEPNLKVRSVLKQKVLDRRSSPLLKSKDRGLIPSKRRPPPPNGISAIAVEGIPNKPESGPGSPQTALSLASSHSSNGSTPIHEEAVTPPLQTISRTCDQALYSSPSMPNISLGRPQPSTYFDGNKPLNEMQVQRLAGRSGLPINSNILQSLLPFYPALPVLDRENAQSLNNYIHEMPMDQGSCSSLVGAVPTYMISPGCLNSEVPLAHQQRPIQKLGRTQSAPLPLLHPMLQNPSIISALQPNDRLGSEQQVSSQQQHNLCKQHVRHTVLARLNKGQVDNMVEENDSLPSQFKTISSPLEALPEVDLIDNKTRDLECELTKQQRDREAFLIQQRELMNPPQLNINDDYTHHLASNHLSRFSLPNPLARALSSPLVTSGVTGSSQDTTVATRLKCTTGIAYDNIMLSHQCICGDNSHHPENAGRLQSIWTRLQETSVVSRCEPVRPRKATLEELQSCHSEIYTSLFGTNILNRQKLDSNKLAELPIKNFVMLPCGGIGVDSDTVWNELHTASAARMAVGCVVDLSFKVATGELKNGFALVRPPGHHAEYQQPMGFCFFNSIAIATKLLRQRLNMEKVLIVDWDVHHGNGLQQMFYDDSHVLYISIHRHDDGNFFPGTGDPDEVGADDGVGFNVNIALNGSLHPPMGNAEYIAAFRTIVMPIARDFDPEIILVACGFDAAKGHAPPLGGYNVTPACFAYLTKQLMQLAKGKIVLALEGGYDLSSVCDCTQECVSALLGDECLPLTSEDTQRKPCFLAQQVLQRTAVIQAPHWPCIKRWVHTIEMSLIEAQQHEKEEVDTVTALASLSMAASHSQQPNSTPDITEEVSQDDEPMEEDNKK